MQKHKYTKNHIILLLSILIMNWYVCRSQKKNKKRKLRLIFNDSFLQRLFIGFKDNKL